MIALIQARQTFVIGWWGLPGSKGMAHVLWEDMSPYRITTFHDGRTQQDQPCPKLPCTGIARVGIAYAPDVGRNWWKCNKCGFEYV